VLLALLLFDLQVLAHHNWDPRVFVFERPADLPADRPWGGGTGYDGQFAYAIALDPLGARAKLDQPDFRYRRIVYPLVVHAVSLGQPTWIPWTMMAVNLLAAALGSVILGELLARRGALAWLALVLPFSLGYLVAVRADLSEPLALTLALGGWLAFENDRPALSVLLFAVGGLAKEIVLLFPAALVGWSVLRKDWRQAALVAISFAPYVAWSAILVAWLGASPMTATQTQPTLIPWGGIQYLADPVGRAVVGMWVLLPAAGAGLWAALDAWRGRGSDQGRTALLVLAHVAFVVVMPRPTWEDPLAILRVGLGLLAALLIWLAAAHRRVLPFAVAWWAPSALVLALAPGML
jgi:hypothetical protein